MSAIIRVENISKKYILGTQKRGNFVTLRDALTEAGKKFCNFINPFTKSENKPTPEELWALKEISFEIMRGEKVGIIGRNGAGKSTFLKILSRITQPTEGKVVLGGKVASLLEVGTGFHPELTGRENIYLNGAILGMTKTEIKKKFDEIVEFAEIERFLDTPVKYYSSGMYVRLAFSVAAHLEPEILIIDEVLAVGDMQFQKKCVGKMEEIGRESKTILFVSHSMPLITSLCSRTILLSGGKLIADGNTHEIVSLYAKTSLESGGRIIWDDEHAPGDDRVRLRSIKIISNGEVTSEVAIDKEIIVEIRYSNFQEGINLFANLYVRDSFGSFILASANLESMNLTIDEWSTKGKPVGDYITRCVIPPNFFNDKNYIVDIRLFTGRSELLISLENIMSFTVRESGNMRKEYMGDWVGVVRPKLAWTTEYMG
jgi:lipopolysaccharide transport system ATP-binding protein